MVLFCFMIRRPPRPTRTATIFPFPTLFLSPGTLAQELCLRFAEKGVDFADAPVARTRQAAVDGTLAITVGGDAAVLERIRPHLACMSNEITPCGGHGAGEAVKLLNTMVVSLTTVALAEAITVARQSGAVPDEVLKSEARRCGKGGVRTVSC